MVRSGSSRARTYFLESIRSRTVGWLWAAAAEETSTTSERAPRIRDGNTQCSIVEYTVKLGTGRDSAVTCQVKSETCLSLPHLTSHVSRQSPAEPESGPSGERHQQQSRNRQAAVGRRSQHQRQSGLEGGVDYRGQDQGLGSDRNHGGVLGQLAHAEGDGVQIGQPGQRGGGKDPAFSESLLEEVQDHQHHLEPQRHDNRGAETERVLALPGGFLRLAVGFA